MSDVFDIVDADGSSHVPVLPEAQVEMRVRPGKLSDLPFVDALQKENSLGLGFMYESALEGHIKKGNLLVAEAMERPEGCGLRDEGEGTEPRPQDSGLTPPPAKRLGYIIATDRYMKRDELGIIYHMCVAPGYRRSLVAANLLKGRFESSAYGCRLYCCWCAQDLSASRFWEAMGFVPLAFRTGSRKSGWKDERGEKHKEPRIHIFWQKRIREGDMGDLTQGGTSYWFPSQTGGGAIAEDRLVLPIPPGTHWSDAKPVVLPEGPISEARAEKVKLLEGEVQRLERERRAVQRGEKQAAAEAKAARSGKHAPAAGGLWFAPAPGTPGTGSSEGAGDGSAADAEAKRVAKEEVEAELKDAKRAVKRAKQKFDPKQEAFARELKDRWLEQVLEQPGLLAPGREKYSVRRQIEATPGSCVKPMERVVEPAREGEVVPGARRLDAA